MADRSEQAEPALRVLFVDDDPNILAGLRRLLRGRRPDWSISFALGPQQALASLETDAFDVVVSDMRMPGMDGADLLVRVRDRHPATVRIILSGQSDRELTVKGAAVAHQSLNKPSDAATIINAISRAQELERRIGRGDLRSVLGGIESLPIPSRTLREVNEALLDPAVDVGRVVAIIEPDLGITSKLLQLVNSAFFSLPRAVSSLREAVSYLGLQNLRSLAASVDMFRALDHDAETKRLSSRLQLHSSEVLRLAQHILPSCTCPSDMYTGALLHDIGLLAVASLLPDAWRDLAGRRSDEGTQARVEEAVLGTTHAEIGAYLLCLWGLPLSAVDVVARHHNPGTSEAGVLETPHAVYLAESLRSETDHFPGHAGSLDPTFVEAFGIEGRLAEWREFRDQATGHNHAEVTRRVR